jgi:hypothetical protein
MRSSSLFRVCAGLVTVAVSGIAFARTLPPSTLAPFTQTLVAAHLSAARYVPPEHLEVGNQVFDGSVGGFRAYLDSKRVTDPQLFGALDPRVRDLESRAKTALTVFAAGVAVGVASTVYAFAGRDTCYEPTLTDPSFATKVQAWGDCNNRNQTHLAIFTAAGLGVITLGGLGAYLLAPHRSDMLNLVNEHNRISNEPIRLQLGYNPAHRLALGGVSTTF